MALHLQLEAEDLMRRGLPAQEAARQAAIAFGGVQQAKEAALEEGTLPWVEDLHRTVRIAARTLLRHRAFAVTAVLALACAIAVNTTMFSVLDAMINPRLGARHPEQLYSLRYYGDAMHRLDPFAPERVLAAGGRTYTAVTSWLPYGLNAAVERGGRARVADPLRVRANFFTTMDITALEGRLSPGPDWTGTPSTMVISERLRAELFPDGEPAVGQSIDIDGRPFTVSGVAPRYAVTRALDTDVWIFERPGTFLPVHLIRLREGVSLPDAQAELGLLAARLAAAAEDTLSGGRFHLVQVTGQFRVRNFHYALIGAVLAVFLVACSNLANLQLARGLGRRSEIALRSALGAARRQVVSQLMIESGILALAALFLALLLAIAGNAILRATIPPNVGDYVVAPQASWRMVLFAAIAAVAALVLVGLIPAIHVSRADLNTLLKSRAGTGAHRANRRIYGTLVVAQIALTLPLVSASILLCRVAWRAARPDFQMREYYGFDPTPLVIANIRLPALAGTREPVGDVAADLVARARGLSGVQDAAVLVSAPVAGGAVTLEDPDGGTRELPAPGWRYNLVSPSYARTFRLPMAQGRDFTEGGYSEPVVLMDRATATYLWPRIPAVGRRLKLGGARADVPWIPVQGIVGDHLGDDAARWKALIDTLRLNAVYRVLTPDDSVLIPQRGLEVTLYVRADGDPQRVASTLRRTLLDLGTGPARVALYVDHRGIRQRGEVDRFMAGLFTTFAILALGLSSLGVYGIVAQSVADRRREMAVRVALGASPRDVVHALLREGNVLVLAGVALGLFICTRTIRWLGSFLGDVDTGSPLFFGGMCLLLFGAMVSVALIPAARATRQPPMDVLRAE